MRAKDWMTAPPIVVPPTTPIFEARQLMSERRIRHLLVMDGDELVGIVTDRDMRLNLPSPATGLSVWEINYLLMKLTVGQVMTKSVMTIAASRPVEVATQMMLEHRIGALPVLDGGKVVGIVTETDLLRALVSALSVKTKRSPSELVAEALTNDAPVGDSPAKPS